MSHIAPIARDSNDYFAANHIVFAVCFVMLQFSIPELLSQLRHQDVLVADIIGVIGVLLFWIAEGCLFLLTFLHERAKKAISHAITMIVVLVPTIFARDTLLFIQFINLYFLSGKYEACARAAIVYEDSGRYRECSVRMEGDSFTIVAYDSGDSLGLPKEQQSESFRSVISRQNPLLFQCKMSAQRLVDHFYFVQLGC